MFFRVIIIFWENIIPFTIVFLNFTVYFTNIICLCLTTIIWFSISPISIIPFTSISPRPFIRTISTTRSFSNSSNKYSSRIRKYFSYCFIFFFTMNTCCLLYTSPSPRDKRQSRMPSSA